MSPRQLPEPSPLAAGGRVELRLVAPSWKASATGPGPTDPERAAAEPATPAGSGQPPHPAGSVGYEARWFTSAGVFLGEARLDPAGEATVSCSDPAAPRWLLEWTCALLRLIARDHEAGTPWPRRLTRWRKAPEQTPG